MLNKNQTVIVARSSVYVIPNMLLYRIGSMMVLVVLISFSAEYPVFLNHKICHKQYEVNKHLDEQ